MMKRENVVRVAFVVAAVLAGAAVVALTGCALGAGAKEGAVAGYSGGPMPTPPSGMGLLDAILFTVGTTVAYGGVSLAKGYIRGKIESKEDKV